ncbi:hypothetical protein Cgig2_021647 [Carnegiea gigantea]|uniref:Auxin-responsive protein n=1 Tax=Carnegiea gigantea TaxID=171969 RepID=A0A9Q1GKI4_9CARY|nr:hypothetical protein Cgig2_021647 [Carnegiea gigantea]
MEAGGSSSVGSGSTVSKEEVVEQENHHIHPIPMEEGSDESELELGLGLSLGVLGSKNYNQIPRILTAKDLELPSLVSRPVLPPSPSSASSCSSLGLRTQPASASAGTSNNSSTAGSNVSTGTKRAASPTAASQVVGWPPIRAYRMNSMATQSKSIATGENSSQFVENNVIYGTENKGKSNPEAGVPLKSSLFVKVNMDGVAIGRKINLNAHSSYESLAQTLEDMFTYKAVEKSSANELFLLPKVTRPSELLDGSSEYVLTYEDKDGDWMLVGDVPWGSKIGRKELKAKKQANIGHFMLYLHETSWYRVTQVQKKTLGMNLERILISSSNGHAVVIFLFCIKLLA